MATKLKVRTGDPKKKEVEETIFLGKNRTPIDDTADTRDILTGLIGKGYTALSDDSIRGGFQRLQALVGPERARKLMTHAFIFNQNPAMQKLPTEAKIKTFYETPSGDADVQGLLGKVKSFGYGVLPGFRESSYQVNQELAGRIPPTTAMVDPALQKIKLRVGQKIQ